MNLCLYLLIIVDEMPEQNHHKLLIINAFQS